MALIDRQTLIDSFCSQCTVDKPKTCSTIRYGDKWCNEVYTILNAPTVDAVPVVHGRWKRHYCEDDGLPDGWQCSVCGEWYYFGENKPNFCPECGTKMNGKQNG